MRVVGHVRNISRRSSVSGVMGVGPMMEHPMGLKLGSVFVPAAATSPTPLLASVSAPYTVSVTAPAATVACGLERLGSRVGGDGKAWWSGALAAAMGSVIAVAAMDREVHCDGGAGGAGGGGGGGGGGALPDWTNAGVALDGWKEFTRAEVAKHKTAGTGIWVTFKDAVYDVTSFVEEHPGGDQILKAAGGGIDRFWHLYQAHSQESVRTILEGYRIGNLVAADRASTAALTDPFALDPERSPGLNMRTPKPFNAEAPLSVLASNYITPNELFYVRNHLPVPKVDPETWRLTLAGDGLRTTDISLKTLKTHFKKSSITAVIQCGGNRRAEMSGAKPVKGLSWGVGAISNARWSGVWLRDVLAAAGMDDLDAAEAAGVKHIQFEGLDRDISQPYGASIPVETALSAEQDVLLAYEMNGEELPADHGFPIRVVVPGCIGARSVKWLGKIVASPDESPSFWQQSDYKIFAPQIDWGDADFATVESMQQMPVQSAICDPAPGTGTIDADDDTVTVRGYAWSGGGNSVDRVDVSLDGGETWTSAELTKGTTRRRRHWGWALWEVELPVPAEAKLEGTLSITSKAVDSSGNSQPRDLSQVWNLRGLANNAWCTVKVPVVSSD